MLFKRLSMNKRNNVHNQSRKKKRESTGTVWPDAQARTTIFFQSVTTCASNSIWYKAWTNACSSSRNVHSIRIITEDEWYLSGVTIARGSTLENILWSVHNRFSLYQRDKRRATVQKKKADGQNSDSEGEPIAKKETTGFQFETEARAAHRRQQPAQLSPTASKPHRKSATASGSNRRSKSDTTTMARDLASTTSTHTDATSTLTAKPAAPSEPKVLTLSERLASIGRIASTTETTVDQTPPTNGSVSNKK